MTLPLLVLFLYLYLSFFLHLCMKAFCLLPISFTFRQRQLALIGLFNCFVLMVCPLMEAAILDAASRNQCMELDSLIWVLCP